VKSVANIITTRDLRKSFRAKGGAVEAVRGVSIDVAQGEVFGFSAPTAPERPPPCGC
jgi:ABC-type glutathione transport system ATPase component